MVNYFLIIRIHKFLTHIKCTEYSRIIAYLIQYISSKRFFGFWLNIYFISFK